MAINETALQAACDYWGSVFYPECPSLKKAFEIYESARADQQAPASGEPANWQAMERMPVGEPKTMLLSSHADQPDDMPPELQRMIGFWSMRPQPGTPEGDIWESGCKQGYEWGQRQPVRESGPLAGLFREAHYAINNYEKSEAPDHESFRVWAWHWLEEVRKAKVL